MLTGWFIWKSGVLLLIKLWKSISPLCNPLQICCDSCVVPHYSFPYWLFIDSKTVSHKCTCKGRANLPSQRLQRSTWEPHLEASTASAAGWWAGVVQSRSIRWELSLREEHDGAVVKLSFVVSARGNQCCLGPELGQLD